MEGHCILGNSLQTYLRLDQGYNFDKLQNIYLLNYNHGPEAMNIIGATSPATFFFSSANDLNYVGSNVTFGQDKPFDSEYQPLYKRDRDYIKAWFYMKYVAFPQTFAQYFPEVDEYLTATFNAITDMQFRQELRNPAGVMANAVPLNLDTTSNVEVIGIPLLKKSISYQQGTSDFEINATVNVAQKPLVLPVEPGNKYSWFYYVTAPWGNTNHATYCDDRALDLRTLPQDGSSYPYLTVNDFLEETVLRVNHPLNRQQYFDGNFSTNGQPAYNSYLLPIKSLFFDYFTIDDLKTGLPGGIHMIEMNTVGTGIKVVIRIPVKGKDSVNYIEYSRIYYAPGTDTDLNKNEGVIADVDFTGYVMPARIFAQENEANYSIGLVSTYNCNYAFSFFNGTKSFVVDSQCRNNSAPQTVKTLCYTLEQHNFDHIVMSDGLGHQGILVPMFSKQLETETFSFAVDLGTSNTHIEYITQRNQTPKALEYGGSQDSPISRMFIHEEVLGGTTINHLQEEEAAMEYDVMPNLLGGKSLFKFPTRTVLNHKSDVNWEQRLKPFELINLPFPYNKKKDRAYNQSEVDLKWGSDTNSDRMMASYIECLTIIMRNMVVMNDGNLSKTKITWFYPISMTPRRFENMRTAWDNMYKQHFNPQGSTTYMTESIAPVRYFYNSEPTARNLVNIDIGGGTTDIAFSDNGELQFVTSFRFASNDLFKCDLGKRTRNGIIDYYHPQFEKILGGLKGQELHDILQGIQSSDNVASFLFTLPENPTTATLEHSSIDFITKLSQDDDFKIVFIIFYGAIIYHIAQILKQKHLPMPRHITLSGNGSRVLRIITSSKDIMSKFTKIIFQLLGVDGSDGSLEVRGLSITDNPKQSTCKGALISNASVNDDSNKIVVMRSDGDGFITNQDLLSAIDSAYEDKATDAVVKCLKFILEDLNKAFNFDDNFGLNQHSLNLAKSWTDKAHKSDIKNFIDRGLQKSKADTPGSDAISETLFFYPFKGIIDDLSANIHSHSEEKKQTIFSFKKMKKTLFYILACTLLMCACNQKSESSQQNDDEQMTTDCTQTYQQPSDSLDKSKDMTGQLYVKMIDLTASVKEVRSQADSTKTQIDKLNKVVEAKVGQMQFYMLLGGMTLLFIVITSLLFYQVHKLQKHRGQEKNELGDRLNPLCKNQECAQQLSSETRRDIDALNIGLSTIDNRLRTVENTLRQKTSATSLGGQQSQWNQQQGSQVHQPKEERTIWFGINSQKIFPKELSAGDVRIAFKGVYRSSNEVEFIPTDWARIKSFDDLSDVVTVRGNREGSHMHIDRPGIAKKVYEGERVYWQVTSTAIITIS